MDSLGLGGGFLSGSSGGILDLEASIHRHQQTHLGQPQQTQQHHMNVMTGGAENDNSIGCSVPKCIAMNCGRGKAISPVNAATNNTTSDEDEPSFAEDGSGETLNGLKGKKGSPWQRMKWTDSVVRLLIAVVAYVGDDGTPEAVEGLKRKSGILQKKGKWKTVSKIMISRGCCVSPQQCEDKFNDLNKRYKQLNKILGRGTTCRVVENPSLLDSMPQLSAKVKDDVRKILSSKHLFYKEMCAYHNGQRIPNCHDLDLQGHSLPVARCSKDTNGSEGEEAEEHGDCDDDELDNEYDNNAFGNGERLGEASDRKKVNEEGSTIWSQYGGGQGGFEAEMAGIFQDPTKSLWEQKAWIKNRLLQLQEQRISIEEEAFELEKRHFKWLRFRSKKDREMERLRLVNERMQLENERMALQLKHKDKEMEFDLKRSEAPLDPGSLGIERLQGRDQIDLGRLQ
ncbi:uncharacterized protein LOC131147929 [Malania oleifera]|uniref:uncharacterized protein LOC131147929 n=1 Tax=Malania oleifera TaxID=397392 RepID=UPI0025AE826B|nr:uncharacterized protein LOC131147929 [Malania oleifera]